MSEFKLPECLAFTAEDFEVRLGPDVLASHLNSERAAERANALLTERLAKLETMIVRQPSGAGRWHEAWDRATHATKILPPWELEK